ncbi:MAG: DUF1801 domain-containing protein [Paracoccaceae bacterium]
MKSPARIAEQVAAVVEDYPAAAQEQFHNIRKAIFAVARSNPAIGPLTETLKWGEPSYLTEVSKSGSTIRVAWKSKKPDAIGLYLNCQTTLLETMRLNYPDAFTYQGNRALLVPLDTILPEEALEFCIELALTYHRSK